ncbi:hypothetical protein F53441_4668 [Fusarium austroafricanum]|uniref:Uncharacterized protein n=1 Tax=Fusarium austroafricanum TaxID=2364996 RepID=A0A8H4P970_9HYPO|nr:hypothetical protein F53441_4668 [Fusarium austroafricanum]
MKYDDWDLVFNASTVSSASGHLDDCLSTGEDSLTPTQFYQMMIGYLTWSLSQDDKAPKQSAQVPGYAQRASDEWASMASYSKDAGDFTLRSLEIMEDMLRYDQDLIYNEKGYFGLTNGGEAEKGMLIAKIDDANDLRLLKKGEGGGEYYEYVDRVFLNFLPSQVKAIQDEATVQYLELR